MKKVLFVILCFTLNCGVFARIIEVRSSTEINQEWSAGDTIEMQNGTWNNQKIKLKGEGNPDNPIVLKAKDLGKVVLAGNSSVSISGKYIKVCGLQFTGVYSGVESVISFRTSSTEFAENCRLTQCTIIDYNPTDNTFDSKWVSIYGKNNRVDHCYFKNKTNSGTLMVVWLTGVENPSHQIDHNYFAYRNANLDGEGKSLNGQEIIRIGDSETSMQNAKCTIKSNYFERCCGEMEIISNKSCGNIYVNNTFYECVGTLTLRHGNACVVDGNYFMGNGVKDTGGTRIIGENHVVINNYYQELTGTNFRAAVCMVCGKENSKLNEYFQVKNALVANNTIVNCADAICINHNSSDTYTMQPITSSILCNLIYNDDSHKSNRVVNISKTDDDLDVTFFNNFINQGKYQSYTPTLDGDVIYDENANMILTVGNISFYKPTSPSDIENHKSKVPEQVATDIQGCERPEYRWIGCIEPQMSPIREIAYAGNTGPDYLREATAKSEIVQLPISLNRNGNKLELRTNELYRAATVSLYTIDGKMLFSKKVDDLSSFTVALPTCVDIYVLVLNTDKGSKVWKL